VRVISRLQLPPDLLGRLNPSSRPASSDAPDLIFYTGCNLLKTPHIGLLCLDVLDALDASYEVHGGPSNCCGILQFRPGDDANAGRQGHKTIERFAETGASQVLSWCPTCQIQFGETLMPAQAEAGGSTFDMTMWPVYLATRMDELRPMLTRPVNKRVALYEFPGAAGVVDAIKGLLGAINGLELVDLEVEQAGYHLTSLATMPDFRRRQIADTLRAAEAANVDTLAGIFHSDHRELVSHQNAWPFEAVNYMELIGEAMGITREDTFKQLKLMADVDAILTESYPMIEQNGLDLDEVREVILNDILGEQYLPTDRALHPGE
jgi:heterodisulfide reductase subunit D